MSHLIYLASGSPRRRELLAQIQVPFSLLLAPVDETPSEGESAADYVQRMAIDKAEAGEALRKAQGLRAAPVLGADTSVVLDGQILGKPSGQAEGVAMLQSLGGRAHQVMTAVAVCHNGLTQVCLSCSNVYFKAVDAELAERYWQTGEPADKAGGYGIQGLAATFVERLDGSYSGVVGLPLAETAQLLQSQGVPVWQSGC